MAVNGRRIAILGGGKIGESLLSGLLSSGWRKPEEIVVTGRRQERIDELAERYGVETTLSNADAVSGAGFIVIAVKPQDFDVLLGEIGGLLTSEQTVLSVAAAMPTAQIEKHLRTASRCCARCRTRRRPSMRASPGSAPAPMRTASTWRWPRRC